MASISEVWKTVSDDFDFVDELALTVERPWYKKENKIENSPKLKNSELKQSNDDTKKFFEASETNSIQSGIKEEIIDNNDQQDLPCAIGETETYWDKMDMDNHFPKTDLKTFSVDEQSESLKTCESNETVAELELVKKEKQKRVINKNKAQSINRELTKEIGHVCDVCGFSAAHSRYLKQHVLTHDERNKLECPKCDYKAFQKQKIMTHVKLIHEGIPFSCNQCTFSSFKELEFRFHKRAVHKGEIYQCEDCPYKTIYPFVMKNHQKTRHTKDEDLIPCPETDCGYQAKSNGTMSYHLNSVHLAVKPSCDICGKLLASARQLSAHIQTVHAETARFVCDKCDYSTNHKRSLKIHNHVKHEKSLFSCQESGCSYRAGTPGSVTEHKKATHLNKILYCTKSLDCEFKTLRRSTMFRHEQSVHEGITYSCDLCSYKGTRKEHLQQHSKTHSKDSLIASKYRWVGQTAYLK